MVQIVPRRKRREIMGTVESWARYNRRNARTRILLANERKMRRALINAPKLIRLSLPVSITEARVSHYAPHVFLTFATQSQANAFFRAVTKQ